MIRSYLSKHLQRLLKSSHQSHILVLGVFGLVVCYHFFVVPNETLKISKIEKITIEKPSLTSKNPQYEYVDALQSQEGDFFRLGVVVKSKKSEQLEILLESSTGDQIKIAEWGIDPSENGVYKDVVFETSGRYKSVIFRLKNTTDPEVLLWSNSSVYLNSLYVTRLNSEARAGIDDLSPTVFGLSALRTTTLNSIVDVSVHKNKWIFQLDGDYLKSLKCFSPAQNSDIKNYHFQLSSYDRVKSQKKDLLQEKVFTVETLNSLKIGADNYLLPLLSVLEKNNWYSIESFFSDQDLVSLSASSDLENNKNQACKTLEVITGEHRLFNDKTILDGAKLEDIGSSLEFYFGLQKDDTDYTNLSSMSQGVRYHQSKKIILIPKKKDSFVEYSISTIRPFSKLTTKILLSDSYKDEAQLEYSVDKKIWKKTSSSQVKNDTQLFDFTAEGDKQSDMFFLRIKYNKEVGEGYFGIKDLSVTSSIQK